MVTEILISPSLTRIIYSEVISVMGLVRSQLNRELKIRFILHIGVRVIWMETDMLIWLSPDSTILAFTRITVMGHFNLR